MMLFHDHAVKPAPLNVEEKIIAQMPVRLQPDEIAAVPDPQERAKLMTAQVAQRRKLEQALQRPKNRSAVGAWSSLSKEERRR